MKYKGINKNKAFRLRNASADFASLKATLFLCKSVCIHSGAFLCNRNFLLHKKIVCLMLVFINIFLLCGFDSKMGMTSKFGDEAVYTCVMFDSIMTKFNVSPDTARNYYDDEYCCVLAHVTSKDSKSITISCVDTSRTDRLKCSISDKQVAYQLSDLMSGDNVLIYCKVDVSTFGKGSVTLKNIAKLERTDAQSVVDKSYILIDGTAMLLNDGETVSLGEKVEYMIPKNWKSIEHKLPMVGDKDPQGFYYKLNELPENYTNDSESLYIFYFDYNKFVKMQDMFKETKKIEQAIVNNIIGEDNAKIVKVKTGYGKSFDYHAGSFYDANQKFHRVEFLFAPVNDDGMCVVMYSHIESKHVDEALLFLRNIETLN